MTEQSVPDQPARRRGRWRRTFAVLLVALAAGSLGAFVTKSFSQGFGPPWHGMMGGPTTPAQIEDRADRMVRHLAIEIDATTDQQNKLQGIVKGAIRDLLPMREQAFAAHQHARDLLTQATIDRGAIEKLRVEQIATADTFSKRIAQALADAADVLTPEQRKKINDFLPPPGAHWRPWQHG